MVVYKYQDYFIAGINHVVEGYFQDIVFIYKNGNNWNAISAEKFRTNDKVLNEIRDAVKFATYIDDLKDAINDLKKRGINIEEVDRYPFPRKLIEGKKKIQAEFD